MLADKNYPTKPKKNITVEDYDTACDRTYIAMNLVEDILVKHPVFKKHKKMKKAIHQIHDDLFRLYQVSGGLAYLKEVELESAENQSNKEK